MTGELYKQTGTTETAKPFQRDLKAARCRSYLLRMWRTDEPGDFRWRALLEIPETGQRIGFPGLEELFAYLMERTTTDEL